MLLHAAYGVLNCLLTALHSHSPSSGGNGSSTAGGASGGSAGGMSHTFPDTLPGAILKAGAGSGVGGGAGGGLIGSYGLTRDPMIRTALLTVLNHFRLKLTHPLMLAHPLHAILNNTPSY